MTRKEAVGKKFGNLLILEIVDKKPRLVRCQCDCGNIKDCDWFKMKSGEVVACGCQHNNEEHRKATSIRNKKMIEDGTWPLAGHGGDHRKHEIPIRPFRCLLTRMRSHASRRGIEKKQVYVDVNDLKDVWEKQDGRCVYSGIELSMPTHVDPNPDEKYKMASIDRIDSNKPYTKDNIQFVSTSINYAKNNMSHEAMIKFLDLIVENHRTTK